MKSLEVITGIIKGMPAVSNGVRRIGRHDGKPMVRLTLVANGSVAKAIAMVGEFAGKGRDGKDPSAFGLARDTNQVVLDLERSQADYLAQTLGAPNWDALAPFIRGAKLKSTVVVREAGDVIPQRDGDDIVVEFTHAAHDDMQIALAPQNKTLLAGAIVQASMMAEAASADDFGSSDDFEDFGAFETKAAVETADDAEEAPKVASGKGKGAKADA